MDCRYISSLLQPFLIISFPLPSHLPIFHQMLLFIAIVGIIVGLMVCSYLSAALAQATKYPSSKLSTWMVFLINISLLYFILIKYSFRKYWPSLLCGLIVAAPPTIAAISRSSYGLTLVQWSGMKST